MTNTVTGAVTGELTPEELAVVGYLIEDWKKRYRVTTVEQGLKASGHHYSTETRLRIGAFLKSVYARNPDFSPRVKRWGLDTLILTNEEKLVARGILPRLKQSGVFPSRIELAQTTGITADQADSALDTLYQLGFLDKPESIDKLNYRLSQNYEKFLQGLGFTYHKVILEDGEEFNVQCSADALILAATDYGDRTVSIEDACFHCLERHHIRTEKGKIISQSPAEIRLYEGDD